MSLARPHVVVVGAGFGGLRTAHRLENAPVDVTLIDRNNYHLFQPLLYQVATAGLSPDDIAHPVRSILRSQKNLEFRLAEVTGVDLDQRQVHTRTGSLPYDYLVLAIGGQTNTFGIESVAENAFGLKGLEDAVGIRNHILRLFEKAAIEPDAQKRRALLTFAIAGGGPTGVECAGAISELIRMVLVKDYPHLNMHEARVVLIEAARQILPALPLNLSSEAAEVLKRKKVEVRFGAAVSSFDGQVITFNDGSSLPAHTLIWAAGVRAAALADALGLPQAGLGRLVVQPTLQVEAHPEVFVIGDAAHLPGPDGRPLPMVAPVAMQQADQAVANIRAALEGQPAKPFAYKDPGALATIGRNAAVASLGKWQFKGFIAWFLWLVVHIVQLVGFRDRLIVVINWAWDYLFYDRAIRLIDPQRSCDT
ncbi:MAG TPA: NAD(P)/FAD-dependent oxidoreductase [Anaerolineaceae bacterium]|nr:NAD(P)/FAD-dependent oxidoreductase [Anaerolineaceae bacterium]HPN53805.1 NAD(P)/FAD-dependent oxidoreductase [Anaerolineaceae bacterium]